MTNPSTNPQLSITLRTDWLAGYLRADRIRYDTLVQLAAALADDTARNDVLTALDELASIVDNPNADPAAVDTAVDTIEDTAGMDTAQIPLDRTTVRRLGGELTTVMETLCRFNPGGIARIPRQPEQEAM